MRGIKYSFPNLEKCRPFISAISRNTDTLAVQPEREKHGGAHATITCSRSEMLLEDDIKGMSDYSVFSDGY